MDKGESCENCPGDCSCCHGIFASGVELEDAELAIGAPDGRSARLLEGAVLEVTLGRVLYDEVGEDPGEELHPDFELVGQVISGSAAVEPGCPEVTELEGAVLVKVLDGDHWKLAGLWTADSGSAAGFDLLCASADQTQQVRLEAQLGAQATLDAIQIRSCVE
jgi:hypothetical protein